MSESTAPKGRQALLSQTLAGSANGFQKGWTSTPEGKGVLLLHQLRKLLGNDVFVKAMDSFGRENAGKEVTTAQFQAHVEKASGKELKSFFDHWLNQPGLPVVAVALSGRGAARRPGGDFRREDRPNKLADGQRQGKSAGWTLLPVEETIRRSMEMV